MPARPDVVAAFESQIGWCERLGSPFTAHVLGLALDGLRAGGVVADLLGNWPGDPRTDALPLRLAGALHALVLTGRDGDLARHYPPNAPGPDFADGISQSLLRHDGAVRDFLTSPPQTNEVGRAAVLLGGFLEIARTFDRPLRLLEIGASAGLNTHWDRLRYRLGGADWGDVDSPVRLEPAWTGPPPPMDAPISVLERAACDRRPVALEDDGERLRLRAYVWADMDQRVRALDGAIELTRRIGTTVEAADAADWVDRQLADARTDSVAVLYHTVVWQYLPAETKARIEAALHAYGARSPLAWLRLELAPADDCVLTLTTWCHGARFDCILAHAHPHGAAVRWVG